MQRVEVTQINVGMGLGRCYDLGVLLCMTLYKIGDFDILAMANNT